MERSALNWLEAWKKSPLRKPLLVQGMRRVGKTWLLRDFAQYWYDNFVHIDLAEGGRYRELFRNTKNVDRIISNLAMAYGEPIDPGSTLLFFDNVQTAPRCCRL